jgi:hypothetical protein
MRARLAYLAPAIFLMASLCPVSRAVGDTAPPIEWPRVLFRDGITNIIFQPQLDFWDNYTWKATAAVAIQPQGAPQPTFGTIKLQAATRVDRVERTVVFEQLQITSAEFPSASAQAEGYLKTLRSLLPKQVPGISLDRVEASLALIEARRKASGMPLNNDPPTIIYSTQPALLVLVDGPPVYRPVENTAFERVFNTRALLLRDQSGKYYLHLFDGYVEAPALSGPWTVAQSVPSGVKKAEAEAIQAKQVDLLAGQANPDTKAMPSLKSTPLPTLHVTTVATELIVTTGNAAWTPIPTTQLLYASNTTAHVFKYLADQKTYVLISGRWFRADTFAGPWEFVAGDALPKDFANIPDDSTAENVKASVPGTQQAQEALIENGIPQTVKVDRKKAKMSPLPQYDGAVQLQAIEGTPLEYAVNCTTPVIRVDQTNWYACQNGVWFLATTPAGPWAAATSVPAVIYSIPPSSPMHYVTYVRIYNHDASYIWVGTTPGFYGTMASADGVVVYGTGYVYPPYVGTTIYVCYPVTYGYGCNPCWTPWAGWSCGFSVGYAMTSDWYYWCCCPPAPYWGPYYGWCYGSYYNAYGGITAWGPYGWAGTSGYIYHQNGPWTGTSRVAGGYNAWTGNQWASQYGRAYNSATGMSVVGQRGAVQNVYTGNYAAGGQGAFYNNQTGVAGTGGKVTVGNSVTGNSATLGRATVYNPNTGNVTQISGGKGSGGNGYVNVNGNVIVGNDGNYYRPDGSGGWEQINKPPGGGNTPFAGGSGERQNPGEQQQWDRVQPSADNQQRIQSLNNESNARQQGAQRQQSFQGNRPTFRGGGGGRRR